MNLLLVDDNIDLRSTFKEVFLSLGYSVVEASDGTEAIDILNKFDFDLIITDVQMPNMNGFDLLVAIKKLKIQTPVVVISGGSKYSREDILNAGASEYFEKCSFNPFNISVFSQKSA